VGDLPDWVYMLQIPADLWPWFTIAGPDLNEFLGYLRGRWHVIAPPAGAAHIAITVLMMGWIWAPFLAHSAPTDLLDDIHCKEARDNRLVHGLPAPRWDEEDTMDWAPLTWAYIDDHGALSVPRPG
jgi:hypothetical protein